MSLRLLAGLSSITLSLTAACSKAPTPPPAAANATATSSEPPPATPAAPASTDHGAGTAIGRLAALGWEFELTLLGTLAPGKESAVEAKAVKSPEGRDWKSAGAYVWVEDAAGNPLTAPSKAVIENGQLHFHAAVPVGAAPATHVVLRIRENGLDERQKLVVTPIGTGDSATKAPAHAHEKTPHDGIIVGWKTSGTSAATGFAEVKLHDDKGDVEVWLGKDRAFKEPFRLPASSRLTLTLVDLGGRTVTLAPRDLTENKDESGVNHITEGQTGYFVFPGTTGEDASALKGKTFSSVASLRFDVGGQAATSDEFLLQPHTHPPGQEH